MVVHIQAGANNVHTISRPANVQSVPFKIHADCDANVSTRFDAYVRKEEDDDILRGAFRGYPLQGKILTLPKGYTGLMMHEGVSPDTDSDDRRFYIIHTFNCFTYWKWSAVPSKNDVIAQAIDWIEVAEALHSPVVEE